MAYDEALAERIREFLRAEPGLTEKRMFGGLAFLIGGRMAVAASGGGGLLLRVDPQDTDELVSGPHAERFVMRGRAMDGWLRIPAEAIQTREELAAWISHGLNYARSLGPKE